MTAPTGIRLFRQRALAVVVFPVNFYQIDAMKPEDVKKMSVNDYLYGEDHVVDERGIATSKEYAGPIPCRRTNSVMVPVAQLEEPLADKFGITRAKEYQDGIETRQTNSKILRGKQISERPFTSHPIPFKVDMSTSKWRGKPKKPSSRDEYLEYLEYVQTSGTPEPSESYTDWAGLRVMSFKDWLKQRKPRTFERFGIIWPIFFWRGDVFLFTLILSAAIALIMTLL